MHRRRENSRGKLAARCWLAHRGRSTAPPERRRIHQVAPDGKRSS